MTIDESGPEPTPSASEGVVAFTGHMMDKVGRVPPDYVPRFPKEKEDVVTQAIRDALDKLDAKVGFCSATCGGDLIFIEEMLRRKGKVHVVLPYEEKIFKTDCVQVPGPRSAGSFQENNGREWLPRFETLIKQVASVIELGKKRPQDNSMASDCCNRVIIGLGLMEAASRSTLLSLLALWDGWSGDAPGGARSTVKLADSLKIPIEYLNQLHPQTAAEVMKAATPPPGIGSQPYRSELSAEPPQEVCAILFADVMKFSELDETKLPAFISGYLQPLGAMIQQARHGGYGPMDFNTWGDGLFCIFDSMLKAGTFALAMQRATSSGAWKLKHSDENLKLRIALHAGPVYRIPDPVFPKDTFMGYNLSFAARIEPVTDPGEIFCSQTFAALAAAEGVQDFLCKLVGTRALAKDFATVPLYRVVSA